MRIKSRALRLEARRGYFSCDVGSSELGQTYTITRTWVKVRADGGAKDRFSSKDDGSHPEVGDVDDHWYCELRKLSAMNAPRHSLLCVDTMLWAKDSLVPVSRAEEEAKADLLSEIPNSGDEVGHGDDTESETLVGSR